MRKLIIKINLTLEQWVMLSALIIFLLVGGCSRQDMKQPEELDSKTMSEEIIRQLKEKEGMIIEDFMIRDYFRKRLEEILK